MVKVIAASISFSKKILSFQYCEEKFKLPYIVISIAFKITRQWTKIQQVWYIDQIGIRFPQ